jgi:ABC-2 type transport system permease protein
VTTPEASAGLQEIQGPAALAGGWRRFFQLLYLISVTEFKKTYFGTVLGYVWSLVRPLLLFAVLLAVFTQVFRLGSQVEHYPVLLLFNIVLFSLFQESTNTAVTSVVDQEGIVRKTQFPRLVIPIAPVLTAIFNFGMNIIVVAIFILAFGISPMWTWLLFPVVVVTFLVLTCAAAMLLSSLYVRFRDMAIIWSVVATTLFYASPVLYPIEFAPERLRDIMFLNPLTPLLVQARKWFIDADAPSATAAVGSWVFLAGAAAIFVTLCVTAVWLFNREAPRMAERL